MLTACTPRASGDEPSTILHTVSVARHPAGFFIPLLRRSPLHNPTTTTSQKKLFTCIRFSYTLYSSKRNSGARKMLYHTSPEVITTAHQNGLFGSAVCFSSNGYSMVSGTDFFVYELDHSQLNIVECCHMPFDDNCMLAGPVVAAIMGRFSVDEGTAWDLLSESAELYDIADSVDPDDDFWIQRQRYEAAVLMGYDGVEQTDENGAMWMLPVSLIVSQPPVKSTNWEGIR